MGFEQIATTWQTILAACGAIALIGGAVTIVLKAIKPFTNLEKRVRALETKVGANEDDLSQLKKMQSAQIQATVAMLDHMITGNHIDGMKETRDGLIKLLVECQ